MENNVEENVRKLKGAVSIMMAMSIIQTIIIIVVCVFAFLVLKHVKNVDKSTTPVGTYYSGIEQYYENYDYNDVYTETDSYEIDGESVKESGENTESNVEIDSNEDETED